MHCCEPGGIVAVAIIASRAPDRWAGVFRHHEHASSFNKLSCLQSLLHRVASLADYTMDVHSLPALRHPTYAQTRPSVLDGGFSLHDNFVAGHFSPDAIGLAVGFVRRHHDDRFVY